MMHLGDYPVNATVHFKWSTNAVAGESITRATNGTLRVYKGSSTTERSSSNGITDSEDFDSLTGVHHCAIDLSDNTDSGFYAAGNEYQVVLQGATIDGKAINAPLAHFSIERAGGILALLKDGTFGLSAIETLVDDIESRLTATRAGYLDNLSGGAVALQSSVDDLEGRLGTPSNLGSGATIAANLVDIEGQTDDIGTAGAGLTAVPWNAAWDAEVQSEVQDAIEANNLDHLIKSAVDTNFATTVHLDSVIGHLADNGTTATFDRTAESLEAIRDRGDAAWTTGGGGSITDILNVTPLIPPSIDLANTATVRLGLMLTNALDDLPSTAEITPGTIAIDRKAIGGTSWTNIVNDAACSESAGLVYFDEVFDAGTGYTEGDSIRVTFKSQKITVSANDYDVTDATGRMFYTEVRQTMRGTNNALLAASYTAPDNSSITAILADTNELQTDWANGGRLDNILDARASQTSVDAIDDYVDNEVAAIKAKTDQLTFTAANRVDASVDAAGVRSAVGLSSANLDTQLQTIDDYLDTEVAAIKAKTDNLPANPAAVGSAMTLTSGERDSIAGALLDLSNGVETGLTPRQALRLFAAALGGKLSGAGTTTITIRNAVADTKVRITATVTEDQNRTAITTDLT